MFGAFARAYFPALLLALAITTGYIAQAQDADLQAQIDDRSTKISELERQIANLQKELDATAKQKQTLQSAVAQLDLQNKKIAANISLTQTQIARTDLEIKRLTGSISTTTVKIGDQKIGIADTLRELRAADNESVAVELFSGSTLSSLFDELATLGALRDALTNKVEDLSALKSNLEGSRSTAQSKRAELAAYKATLAQQQQSLAVTKNEKNKLLAETKNQESAYQILIAQKKTEQQAFEAELVRLAQGLGTADTSTAPSPARGILGWPLDAPLITQHFGNTDFARGGAYNGGGHNGIDFRAAVGTPIRAALSGVVQEVNQGVIRNCQYGKWVLIKHDNGLTSLYAHLSNITVSKGQRLPTGALIGYSGDTGYATGPHLHFTLYVSSVVTFKQYTCNNGAKAFIPIAPLNAYLNPLSYLPR